MGTIRVWDQEEKKRDLLLHAAWLEGQKLAKTRTSLASGLKSKEFLEMKAKVLNQPKKKPWWHF